MKPDDVRRQALGLPDTTEEPQLDCSFFTVRGRVFATITPDKRHLHVFLDEAECDYALHAHPDFIERLDASGRLVGVSVRLADALPRVVERLVAQAWARDARERLLSDPRRSGRHRRLTVT